MTNPCPPDERLYCFRLENDRQVPFPCHDESVWLTWMGNADRLVKRHVFLGLDMGSLNGCVISTVFVGKDQSNGQSRFPLLWETRVFSGPWHGETRWYSTHEAALRGHEEVKLGLKKLLHLRRRFPNGDLE